MTFWPAFALVLLRDLGFTLLVILTGELIRRYWFGEPMPFWGE
jgi:hypothetical protein